MRARSFLSLGFLLLFSLRLQAACSVNLTYENGAVKWTPIAGAVGYLVQESLDDMATSRNVFLKTATTFPVNHRATYAATVSYIVTAYLGPGILDTARIDSCTSRIDVKLTPDPELVKMTRRAIIPVAGSTPGAFGGRFKTSLTLRQSSAGQFGRIIFHPAGKPASDDDPSLPYRFTDSQTLAWDDVVAAMGQSGIGSLDIIPDISDTDNNVPRIEARIFNDTAQGTFGSDVAPVYPYDYLHASGMSVEIPDTTRFRVNVGFRAMTDTEASLLIFGPDRRLRDFKNFTFPAGWMQLTGVSQFAGSEIQAGESIRLTFTGLVIPFYTVTENKTNDPTLVVPPPVARSVNVGRYVD